MDIKQLYQLYRQHPCITTDSRSCPPDSIFLALKGASFNGNHFARQALEQGCAYAVVDELEGEADPRIIVVDDALQTFKDLAREHRRQFDIPVMAITGTNGKTTTKELTRAVLAECYNVLATEGNYNNDVGVPKTLLRLDESHDIAIVEMGASHPGDIRTLVETAEPTFGLITNVGRAHLQGFGSFEGVCRTKGELYDYLRQHDLPAIVHRDDEHLMQMSHGLSDCYFYGQAPHGDTLIRGEILSCSPFLHFRWCECDADAGYRGEWQEVETQLIGAYNLANALAAVTVGYVNHVPFDRINHALSHYVPQNNRSQLIVTERNRLVVDAYNANPSSMAAAIENFRLMDAAPKMVILGDMRELGEVSAEEHTRVVRQLDAAGFDAVWLVGPEFQRVAGHYRTFATADDVKAELQRHQPAGYHILIKGSNGLRLYQLPELL